MHAIVYDDFEGPLELRTVPDPTPSPDGVVLKVGACGLCRSDWHGWKGHDPLIEPPNVPGHEMAGIVSEVGEDVTNWTRGDRVTVPFVGGCGTCAQCRAGHPQVCPNQFQPGFSNWGAFAEYVAIEYADETLVRLPDGIDATTAASLGCRFATAFRAVVDQGEVRAGDWVAVHGCGGLGLSAVMIAATMGTQVVAVDVKEEPLHLAEEIGAVETIHAERVDDVVATVREISSGGLHVSLDCIGHPDACVRSVSSLRKRGRHVQVGLLVGNDVHPHIPMDRVVADELELRGTHGIQHHRYPALLDMISAGALRPERLVTRTIPLSEAGTALMEFGSAAVPGVTVIDEF